MGDAYEGPHKVVFRVMEKYYRILQVGRESSEAEIKNAYRKLAKQFHPDRNHAADAQDRFIEITEAYEALMDGKDDRTADFYASWSDQPDPEALRRERAAQYARMRYEDFKRNNEAFKRSWYFPIVRTGVGAMVIIGYFMAAVFFLSPLIGWMIWGANSLVVAAVMFLVSGHIYRFSKDLQKESRKYW